ncbi:MAG: DUF192 domain-containing protein [Pseudomonadales bacterium]|jgi:uncharacterized membrane protein (UPF0127 family)|nr:DUF192 domain-containing protein [Pseudomonadales bacterium]
MNIAKTTVDYFKITGTVFILLGLIVLVIFINVRQTLHGQLAELPDRSFVDIEIGQCHLTVEVVNTRTSITQGLSDRKEIGSDGMIFVMSGLDYHRFWMPRMHFSIDIVWLNDDQVVDITHNVPHPNPLTPLQSLPTYQPKQLSNLVLELYENQAKECKIETDNSKLILHRVH